jgi:SAM-dependent methyltransferase
MTTDSLAVRLVNQLLSVKPLADLARRQARKMMIQRAESVGVRWTEQVATLRQRPWKSELSLVEDVRLDYPEYYLKPFHAYAQGNLCWDAALEVEVAAHAAHARIWPQAGAQGDAKLRESYHKALEAQLPTVPHCILDIGCSVGMSTMALQSAFPAAAVTGLDLSPYFLAVAAYRAKALPIRWLHRPAEATHLPPESFDLVSACLLFHELPKAASRQILQESYRLLQPGGYLAIMDMNPHSDIYKKMPAYILTLLKSTEPYLDEYFSLDLEDAIVDAGFTKPSVTCNTPRHRILIARRN